MAKKRKGFPIPAKLVELILMGQGDTLQLQDLPILGDVWIAYAERPANAQDLLITPQKDVRAGAVREISKRIVKLLEVKGAEFLRNAYEDEDEGASIAYLQGIVAAKLYFEEVLSVLVPMTQWWRDKNVQETLRAGDDYTTDLAKRIKDLFELLPITPPQAERAGVRHYFTALDRYVFPV